MLQGKTTIDHLTLSGGWVHRSEASRLRYSCEPTNAEEIVGSIGLLACPVGSNLLIRTWQPARHLITGGLAHADGLHA